MKKDWILLDSDSYGESMWEESSILYWCGGDTYAIVFDRNVVNIPRQEMKFFYYNVSQVKDAWKNEKASYNYYRENT